MEGYDNTTYGQAFADVYDDWYLGVSDVHATVAELAGLAGDGRVLELGVGTGRLAIPLATALGAGGEPARVTGIDASVAMIEQLRRRDVDQLVDTHIGDMIDDVPAGPFSLVFVAYNTLFNLAGDGDHARCFAAVADVLLPGGRFVVEAFVPDDPPRDGDVVEVRDLAADRVVLAISRHDADHQRAEGQFVELSESGGVRLRPWSIRYARPDQLDAAAAAAGLSLEHRWEAFGRIEFDAHSPRHVSVYTRN